MCGGRLKRREELRVAVFLSMSPSLSFQSVFISFLFSAREAYRKSRCVRNILLPPLLLFLCLSFAVELLEGFFLFVFFFFLFSGSTPLTRSLLTGGVGGSSSRAATPRREDTVLMEAANAYMTISQQTPLEVRQTDKQGDTETDSPVCHEPCVTLLLLLLSQSVSPSLFSSLSFPTSPSLSEICLVFSAVFLIKFHSTNRWNKAMREEELVLSTRVFHTIPSPPVRPQAYDACGLRLLFWKGKAARLVLVCLDFFFSFLSFFACLLSGR